MTSLLEHLQELYLKASSLKDPSQKVAWERFLSMGMPTKDLEAFRYINLQNLGQPVNANGLRMEPRASIGASYRLVFVDGVLSTSLSSNIPKEIVAMTLQEALKSYGPLLKGRFAQFLKEEFQHSLPFLNHALFEEGYFIYIPPSVQLSLPLEIVEIYTTEPQAIFPKFCIYIGRHAQVSIGNRVAVQGSSFINRVMELHLEAGSSCVYEKHLGDIGACSYFDHVTAYLKRDARLININTDAGTKLLRQELQVHLLEEGAEASVKGLSILGEDFQSHHHVQIKHLAPYCRSHQHFKGALFDRAKESFEGKIWVDPIAQKTEAYQLANYLLLGDYAAAYSKPNLEIFADDVKASHGATIAQQREEELFYLKTRGLSNAMARELLLKAFCIDILKEFTIFSSYWQQYYIQVLNQRIHCSYHGEKQHAAHLASS